MTEICTVIEARGHTGILEHGRKTVPEMIKEYRDYSAHLRRQADLIDAAKDEDFIVKIVKGSVRQRLIETLQGGA